MHWRELLHARRLIQKCEENRPPGVPRGWDNIKMNLRKKKWWCGLDSSGLGQKLVVDSCEHGNELSDSKKLWDFLSSSSPGSSVICKISEKLHFKGT
jgi:hypothetical protein